MFMKKHSREVLRMRITEWNTEEAIAVWREEAMEEGLKRGLERGRTEGRAEGLERGLERGRTEGKRETARKLKAMGLSAEQIAAATGLPLDEVR